MEQRKNIKSIILITLFITVSANLCFSQNIILPFGSTWKYLDDGSNQGTDWREISFDDSNWESGVAQLGYGGDGEVTVVEFGPDSRKKYMTTYFRKIIEIDNPSQYIGSNIKFRYDDGGVVYLNGKEVLRSNMREGEVKFDTRAIGGSGEDEIFLLPSLFREGKNILAVEVHQSNSRSSDLAFDLELSEATKLPDFTRKPPYLIYNGNPNEMELHWQVSASITTKIEWGAEQTYSNGVEVINEYGNYHQHKFVFKDLKSSQKYYYKVSINDEVFTGSFLAAPPSNSKDVKFLIFGDTRSFPNDHDNVAKAMISNYTSDKNYQTLLFCVGDLVTNGDSESQWDKQYFDQQYSNIIKLHAEVPFQAAIGNHEGSGKLFQRYFPYPFVDGRYWSFDYGPAHFVVFDQYQRSEESIEKELKWLEEDLANSEKKWKIIFLHEPGWTAGRHENNEGVQNYLQPLSEKYGVSAIFGGHNHYYARAVVNGIQHITTGGGGAPLYEPEEDHPNVELINKVHHFCTIEINGDKFLFSAVSAEGDVFDTFEIKLEK
jgi:hypothetical protein